MTGSLAVPYSAYFLVVTNILRHLTSVNFLQICTKNFTSVGHHLFYSCCTF